MKIAQKTSLAVLVCGVCLLLLTGGICAYLISTANQANSFTVGENVTQSYEKKVMVRNVRNVPCYVRVFAEFSDPEQADAMRLDFNTTDWTVKQTDGYYYYKKILPVGEATAPLFEEIYAEKDSAKLELIVYSESVQAEGSTSPQEAFQNKNN